MSRPRLALAGLVLAAAGCSRQPDEPPKGPVASGPSPTAPATLPTTSDPKDPNPAPPAASPEPADDVKILAEAEKIAQTGNFEAALDRAEDALKIEPENREALFLASAMAQARAGELDRPQNNALFLRSAQAIRKLRDAYKDLQPHEKRLLADALYNEACTHAVGNEPEKALRSLTEADAAGFAQIGLLDADDELKPIRALPKYRELRDRVAERATAEARARAKSLFAENQPFPFDFKLPGLDDKPVALADLKGKVAILDVWGTWCPPCRMEVPHLVALYKTFHDKGLEIVGLNDEQVPPAEVKATIQSFVKENGIPYPCLILDDATRRQIPDFQGYPTTLFLDRSGKVRAKLVGYDPRSGQERVMEEIVTTLLDEDASGTGSKN